MRTAPTSGLPSTAGASQAPDGLPLWIDGVILDLAAHKDAEPLMTPGEAQKRQRSGHDALTCLPDRTLIRDRLQQILLRSQRDHHLVAALLVDLDNFQAVNDTSATMAATSS